MKISTQKIAFIAMMSAFCVISRLGMLALPNVQPITVVVIWMTLELAWGYGASISILSILISNLLISVGPWTLYQMVSFSIVCLCATLLSPLWKKRARYPKVSFLIFPIFAGLMGYLYGFIISGIWVLSMPGLNFWIYYANGILFDTYHALGNIAFWILLIPIFERLNPFEKLKK